MQKRIGVGAGGKRVSARGGAGAAVESLERRRLFFAGLADQTFDFDGKLTFDGGAGSRFVDVQVQADGKVLAFGQVAPAVQSPPQFARFGVFRFTEWGELDLTFGGGDGIAEVPNTWDWSPATI